MNIFLSEEEQKILSDNQAARIGNIRAVESGISLIGSIAGVIYSKKTGGGFWRGVGYFILGGLIFGVPARLIGTPFINKIIKEAKTGTQQQQTSTSSTDW